MPKPRIEMTPTARIDDAAALSRIYTPGVADACREIAAEPASARRLTTRGNSVAVVSDGSAVLGLLPPAVPRQLASCLCPCWL